MLTISDLSVRYDKNLAVDRVSLTFEAGKINGLMGPNGAGKSSMLKACVGLIDAYSGTIRFADKNLRDERFWVKQHCVYAPEQAILMPYLTGLEFMKLMAAIYKIPDAEQKITEILEMLNLFEKKDELISNYSHGMRQKLSVAVAFLAEPAYILLDESLNGLDSISLLRIKKRILSMAAAGKTIVISSHNAELLREWCDIINVLYSGKLKAVYSRKEIEKWESENKKPFVELYAQNISG